MFLIESSQITSRHSNIHIAQKSLFCYTGRVIRITNTMKTRLFLYLVSIGLFAAAAFLPFLVSREAPGGTRAALCSYAIRGHLSCQLGPVGYICGSFADNPMPQEEVADYCGTDWETPALNPVYGYTMLWKGMYFLRDGVLVWFGSVFFLLAFVMAWKWKPMVLVILALIALACGLTVFRFQNLTSLGFPGASVDHLAIGYYLWMASFATFGVYGYLRQRAERVAAAL